ncbi:uncharacterized protein VTP21DRAFT_2756 [Calcarisporiella thermophila]|uniref:uncharacterized protein n=1 Tax=Calcarisporiella thermophila TaxID=911321 RepID=UPI003743DEED
MQSIIRRGAKPFSSEIRVRSTANISYRSNILIQIVIGDKLRRITAPRILSIYQYSTESHFKSNDKESKDEFKLNYGKAIQSLRSDLPIFFEQGLREREIYSANIIISDPRYTGLKFRGKLAYFSVAELLRWSLGLYFSDIRFDILSMREDGPERLHIRWVLEGTPRSLLRLSGSNTRSTYEGVFLYKFDTRGLIYEHRLESIVPAPSRRAVLFHGVTGWLWWRLRYAWQAQRRHQELGVNLGIVGAKTRHWENFCRKHSR